MADNSNRIKFLVSMHEVPGLIGALKDEGVDAYMAPNHGLAFDSYYYDIFVDIVKSPYFMPSISAAIVAYLKRNDSKSVTMKREDGSSESFKGYTTDEIAKILGDAKSITVKDDKPT